ncbi:MAG: YdcF family protein [Anaerostipes sp.]|nr:YdcF family protein [Anaerostipes sp.]
MVAELSAMVIGQYGCKSNSSLTRCYLNRTKKISNYENQSQNKLWLGFFYPIYSFLRLLHSTRLHFTIQIKIRFVKHSRGKHQFIDEATASADMILVVENGNLLEQGIPENRILKEDRSTTTRENLIFSKKIMEERTKDYYCVIATNNFHVLRAAIFAKVQGLNGEVIGGKTARYYHPVAVIREHVA